MNIDIILCRRLLQSGIAEVRKFAPGTDLKAAWVWKAGRDHWEFHGPDKYYWHGRAGNAYDARYKGWMAWLKSKGWGEETEDTK